MQPIPETAALIQELRELYDIDLFDELHAKADAVKALVPDLVGVSLALLGSGVAFTLVATDREVAVLDGIQYIMGGPCADVPETGAGVVEFDADEVVDERRWQGFAKATAAKGVATTLTLPILRGDTVVGTVNLYAASGGAFAGLHRDIADIFGAWAAGAVMNADLSFQTRRTAEHAPDALHASMQVDMAAGVLAAAHSVDVDTARELLEEAATRAGVTVEALAETVLKTFPSADDT